MAIIRCQNCGGEMSDKGRVCPHCGAPIYDRSSQDAYQNQSRKKRGCAGCLITGLAVFGAFVLICIIGMLIFSGDESKPEQTPQQTNTIENSKSSTPDSSGSQSAAFSENPKVGVPNPPPEKTESKSGNLGDYNVEIKEAFTTTDYAGKPAIVVTYSWTNNSDETTNCMTSVLAKAFQDGVQLETAIIGDSDIFDSSAYMKDIRPGVTLDIQQAFSLESNSNVEIEISEWIGFSDDVVSATFSI